jgi:hypothetical protein
MSREQRLVALGSCPIMDEYPTDRDQGFPEALPVAGAGDDLDVTGASPIAGYRETGAACPVSHHRLGEGSFWPCTRGRPMVWRVRGGGGSYKAASPENLLTNVRWRRC